MYSIPNEGFVNAFIVNYDNLYEGKLSKKFNYSRVVCLSHFSHLIQQHDLKHQKHVGVVSGSIDDPELKLIEYEKLIFMNFPEDQRFDLDKNWITQEKK